MHAPERSGEFIPCPALMAQGSLCSSILDDVEGHFLEFQKPSYAISSEIPLMSSVTAVEQQIHADPFSPSSSSCMSVVHLAHYDLNCPPIGRGIIKQEAESQADGNYALMNDGGAMGDDFLSPAANCDGARRSWDSSQPQVDWLPFAGQFSACQQQQQQNQQVISILASRMSTSTFRNPTVHSPGFGGGRQLGISSSDSVISVDQESSRPDEDTEKIAKRQRRMIKNRESAARSRAKKQAHINHLQQRAEELINENKRLKRKQSFTSDAASRPATTRVQLRRTTSI